MVTLPAGAVVVFDFENSVERDLPAGRSWSPKSSRTWILGITQTAQLLAPRKIIGQHLPPVVVFGWRIFDAGRFCGTVRAYEFNQQID